MLVLYNVPGHAGAYCQTGKGYHRVRAYCAAQPGGWGAWFIGSWQGAGSWSTIHCGSTRPHLVDAVIEKA
ncbi:hypothetical protein AB0M35_00940 [Micromonospora sp. NPDC051196]|uniref:hypothetical protein n=1 Tax=Micromonospora sp. NPDC051196 TaxID=3155281 RepID=UPI00343AF734